MIQIKVQKKKEGKTKYSFTSCLFWVGTGVREPRILGAGLEKIHTPSLSLLTSFGSSGEEKEEEEEEEGFKTENEGYSSEFLVRLCSLVFQTLTLFQTKICNILVIFSHLASKILTHFQTCFLKAIPIFRLTGQNGSKTVPFDTACTYTAYIGE